MCELVDAIDQADYLPGFFVQYARRATAVSARAGLSFVAVRAGRMPLARSAICRVTDSNRFCLELPAVSQQRG